MSGILTQWQNIPSALHEYEQFLCFDPEKKPRSALNGRSLGWQDNLTDFPTAVQFAAQHELGVGIAFNGQKEISGFDLDGCLCPETMQLESWANTILKQLSSYREVSISRTGIKVLCFGHHSTNLPKLIYGEAKYAGKQQQIEFRSNSGYFALTGWTPSFLPQFAITNLDVLAIYKWLQPNYIEAQPNLNSKTTQAKEAGLNLELAARYVEKMPEAISGQNGHDSTFTVACRLIHGFDLTPAQALPLLQKYNQRCKPPWNHHELIHKLQQANKQEDGEGKPRGYLVRPSNIRDYQPGAEHEKADLEFKAFPTALLPQPFQEFVRQASDAICCDPTFVALPLLAALASAIGDSTRLYVKNTWQVPCITWAAFIGESGTAKSPAIRTALQFVTAKQTELTKKYETIAENHERAKAIYEQSLAKWKKNQKWQNDLQMPVKPSEPPQPRTLVNDATIEALVSVLADNPKGVLCAFDELSGWIGSFDRYHSKADSDSASWLSIHNGDSISVDRKNSGYTLVPNAFVSLTGGIQPGTFTRCFNTKHRDSGLLQRILIAWPDRKSKKWSESDVSDEIRLNMHSVFDYCYALQPKIGQDGRRVPSLLYLNSEARKLWIDFYDQHNLALSKTSGSVAAAFSKLEEYPLRIAIIFHSIKKAVGESFDDQITPDTLQSAIDLTIWFRNEAERIYEILDFSSRKRNQDKLAQWIENRGGTTTVRDVQRYNKSIYPTSEVAAGALEELIEGGMGYWEIVPTTNKGGRPTKQFRLYGN